MIKVNMNERDMANAFDRAMRERAKDGHEFKPMDIGGMENICDICFQVHKESVRERASK